MRNFIAATFDNVITMIYRVWLVKLKMTPDTMSKDLIAHLQYVKHSWVRGRGKGDKYVKAGWSTSCTMTPKSVLIHKFREILDYLQM